MTVGKASGPRAMRDATATDLWLAAATLRGRDRRRWCDLARTADNARVLRGWVDGSESPPDDEIARQVDAMTSALARAHDHADTWRARTRDWLARSPDHALIGLDDPAYPALLGRIDDPPPVLYAAGQAGALARPSIAIVGARRASPGAVDFAHELAADLAAAGFAVTSGLANGIDGAAHRGALETGTTIAVLATDIDGCYPHRHRALSADISRHGVRISEFPHGSVLHPGCFPKRNRLVSGLAYGVVVVEAALRSGSLITARHAIEQNREVMAVPGDVHNPAARGCHALLRDGAGLVESAADVLAIIGPALARELPTEPQIQLSDAARTVARAGASGTDERLTNDSDARILLAQIGFDPVDIDTLVCRTELPAADVLRLLGRLEGDGRVAALPGGRFAKSVDRR